MACSCQAAERGSSSCPGDTGHGAGANIDTVALWAKGECKHSYPNFTWPYTTWIFHETATLPLDITLHLDITQ